MLGALFTQKAGTRLRLRHFEVRGPRGEQGRPADSDPPAPGARVTTEAGRSYYCQARGRRRPAGPQGSESFAEAWTSAGSAEFD